MSDNGLEGPTTHVTQDETLTTETEKEAETETGKQANTQSELGNSDINDTVGNPQDDKVVVSSTSNGSVIVEAEADEVPGVQLQEQEKKEDGQSETTAAATNNNEGSTELPIDNASPSTAILSSSSNPIDEQQQTNVPPPPSASTIAEKTDISIIDDDASKDEYANTTITNTEQPAAPSDEAAVESSQQTHAETLDMPAVVSASSSAQESTVDNAAAAGPSTSNPEEEQTSSSGNTANNNGALTNAPENTAISATLSNTGSATGSATGGLGGAGVSSSSPAASASGATRPTAPKKFTSSLSMNKKFLEKSGATDAKSPQPASASLPRAGTSPVARSPAIASPSVPAHPGTSASPPITTSSSAPASHPRLLTGKLSSLSTGTSSGLGSSSSSATWGRPGLAAGKTAGGPGLGGSNSSTAFGSGRTGFVPAPPVIASGITGLARPGPGVPTLGRMRGFGSGRSAQAPWAAQGRPGGPTSGNGRMEHDFPSFQEAARAEQQRQNAVIAKEQAEKMAAAQQAAYNQRVLEGLKSFSGEYTSGTSHWDELDDDDDDLGDVLEFADGTRYEVPQSATLPPITEATLPDIPSPAQQQQQQQQQSYRPPVQGGQESRQQQQAQPQASAQAQAPTGSSISDQAQNKSERFVDDFDRGQRSSAAANIAAALEASANQNAAGRQPQSGRTLFNDRLGRFEPYAGRQPPKKEQQQQQKTMPPPPATLLQRTSKQALSPQEQTRPSPTARISSGQQIPSQSAKTPLQTSSQQHQPNIASQTQSVPASRKTESPWAKLPPVPKPGPLDQLVEPEVPSQPQMQQTKVPASSASGGIATDAVPAQASSPAVPTAPAEDPEEAYKKQMRNIAETARKRRQEEEAEREAQKERARKKLQELEEKMKSPAVPAASEPTGPAQTTILSPPVTKADRDSNWRRTSVTDAKVPQAIHTRKVSQSQSIPPEAQARANYNDAQANKLPQPAQAAQSSKAAPSAAAFAALAEVASASWRLRQDNANSQQTSTMQGQRAPKRDASLFNSDIKAAGSLDSDALLASPPSTVPRVRLGRRYSPDPTTGPSHDSVHVPHAFPQPTILVGRGNVEYNLHSHAPRPTSALDKIMLQVKAAQDDLKTRQTAAAMLEEEKRRMHLHGSSQEDFDGALSRISLALNEAMKTGKGKAREPSPPAPVQMFVRYVPEPFEHTRVERPGTPRSWKTFNVKVPSITRPAPPPLSYHRIRYVEDATVPSAIFSSSWIPPKGVRIPRYSTLESYLNDSGDAKVVPRVKFSRFYLPDAAVLLAPDDHLTSNVEPSGSVRVTAPSLTVRQLDGQSGSWRSGERVIPVEVRKESITVLDPPILEDVEEDMATMPFEEEDSASAVIKVSLPKKILSQLVQTASFPRDQSTLDAGRFRAYGPRLPENSTVAFRRGISPVKATEPAEALDKHMFMVNSELNGSREELQQTLSTRASDQQVIDEVSAPSKASVAAAERERAAREAALKSESGRPSPTNEPIFPSLSFGPSRAAEAVDQSSSISSARREELPRHVIAELERLNASVSSAPLTVPPRLDTPASMLAGRSASPWGVTNSKASMMPSALSLSAIDPSMSVWSKPTEETAAAAAAAFNSAVSKDSANESVQENSLRDLADDYPSSMPSNAMDLPISDGERPQSKDSEVPANSSSRSRSHDRSPQVHQMSISQVMNTSSSPSGPQSSIHAPRHGSSSSRHGSFAFSPGSVYTGERSPYTVHSQLPYSPIDAMSLQQSHQPTMYSSGMSAYPSSGQYGGFVAAGTPAYSASYSQAGVAPNGMTMLSPGYSPMQVAMTGQDGRSVSGHVASNGSLWVPSGSMQGTMMNGGYSTAGSPYNTSAIGAGAPAYPGKSRVHSSPMYQATSPQYQQRVSPVNSDPHRHHQQHSQPGYTLYGYPASASAAQGVQATSSMTNAHHPYSAFSPQLPSSASVGALGMGGMGSGNASGRDGYSNHSNAHVNHLRSASAQQYGRRQGW